MWQMWYTKWRTAEFLNNSNTEEMLSERGEGSMKLGESKELRKAGVCSAAVGVEIFNYNIK